MKRILVTGGSGFLGQSLAKLLVDDFLALDGEWRKRTTEIDLLRGEQKKPGTHT